MGSNGKCEIIKKDNDLVEARYKLSIHEQRLIWTLLSNIRMDDQDFKKYTINIKDMAEYFGLENNKDLYDQIQNAARSLRMAEVDISIGKLKRFTGWFNYAEYEEGKGKLVVSFNAELKPYLLQLKSSFTQYELAAVVNFKNSYSIRFYEFLKMRQNQGEGGRFFVRYAVKDLRIMLGLAKHEYLKNNDLKRFVIEPSLQEIDTQTDLHIVSIEYLKTGRAISDLKIYAEPKQSYTFALPKALKSLPNPPKAKKLPESIRELIQLGISESEAQAMLKQHNTFRIMQAINYTKAMMTEKTINSPAAYLRTVLKGDAGEAWMRQQEQQEHQKKLKRQQEQEALEKKAKEEKKQEENRQEWTRLQGVYESLAVDIQTKILDDISEIIKHDNPALCGQFEQRKRANTAHKSPFFMSYFKQVLSQM